MTGHEGQRMAVNGRDRQPAMNAGSAATAAAAAAAAVEPSAPARLTGLPPVLARHTRCIVLGSFPGVASLAAQQYYGHPRNHFWPLLSAIWGVDFIALPYRQRLAEMRRRGLGLWDAYASCERVGSLDAAIEAAEMNDFARLCRRAPSLAVAFHNGSESARTARALYAFGLATRRLPSTSPANASWSFERKLAAWRAAFEEGGIA